MKRFDLVASLLAASTIVAGAAYAADQAAAPPTASQSSPTVQPGSAAQKAVDQYAVKLSSDGAGAFRDMHLARLAIFDADPAQAKTLVGKARTALATAKTDESVFTKAEADLKPPGAAKPAAAQSKSGGTASGTDMTKPVTWLPVDGQLVLGEDFIATPQKSAAVADANQSLEKGDRKGATEKLKLAGIDVNFTMAVLPLDRTTSDVDQAATLLDQGKYYEANAILKQAEDGMRFDMVDTTAIPQKAAAATGTAAPAAKEGQTTSATAKPSTH
ncbi:YfdX family protein [Methylobacterium haplocladii]|uniref:Protein YfdX n=1 Tax=Methylobacterium haplocladii TaxID=1176176 RepID=A0A512IVI9_9HYPH|nr:YfdX family protein [Methylobacterium haplocladii]GEP01715.1 protein YfdX [Methylobacterium haplocladii]GJD85312.1 Protein YfdX [Methylobacterium haplocladii]GLS59381.1 protein YfdX [Methylobacterium haplocladii]